VRLWKDNEIKGKFDPSLRRYHFDVWGTLIFSAKMRRDAVIASCFDLVVTDYYMFESLFDQSDGTNSIMGKLKNMVRVVSDAVMVEPYDCVVPHQFRSNLVSAQWPGSMCVPAFTGLLPPLQGDFTFKIVTNPLYVFRNLKGEKIDVDLSGLHLYVKELRKRPRDKWSSRDKDLDLFSSAVFVQREWRSVYDGDCIRHDELARRVFIRAFIQDPLGDCVMSLVPYKIARYPYNHRGTLIKEMRVMMLEEFLLTWRKIFAVAKIPYWLLGEDFQDEDNVMISSSNSI
jgi:hypothetical protein